MGRTVVTQLSAVSFQYITRFFEAESGNFYFFHRKAGKTFVKCDAMLTATLSSVTV